MAGFFSDRPGFLLMILTVLRHLHILVFRWNMPLELRNNDEAARWHDRVAVAARINVEVGGVYAETVAEDELVIAFVIGGYKLLLRFLEGHLIKDLRHRKSQLDESCVQF